MKKNILHKSLLKKEPLELASANLIRHAKRYESIDFFLKAKCILIEHKRVLIVSIYQRERILNENNMPIYRIFMTKEDYITQSFKDENMKWLSGCFYSIFKYDYRKNIHCYDMKSEKALNSFFKYLGDSELSPINKLINAQYLIMQKRLEKKHKIIKNRIDSQMQKINPLPKDFETWLDKTALSNSRYIYYKYSSKKYMDGYCTYCHNEVKVTGIKHRMNGVCPKCGKKVTFLAEKKARRISDKAQAVYFQKIKNGFVVRYFAVYKHYGENYRIPKIYFFELKRDFYEDGDIKYYEWRNFKQTGILRWCEDWQQYPLKDTVVYTKNLKTVLKGTKYQYCALKEFSLRYEGAPVYVHCYLKRYLLNPYIEYMVKMGLYTLVNEMTSGYHYYYEYNSFEDNAKSLDRLLGISKNDIVFAKNIDISFAQLKIFKKLKEKGICLKENKFLEFYNKYNNCENVIFNLLSYTTLHKIECYCQKHVDSNRNYENVLSIWNDYLNSCVELGYDLNNNFVLFPKKLIQAHDNAIEDIRKKREQEYQHKIIQEEIKAKELFKKYRKLYSWSDDKFSVIVPKDLFEIKSEGNALHHCVGNYVYDVADGKCIILFVRKNCNLNKSFYTLEIVDGRIVQCRGFSNHDMTKELTEFIEKYKCMVLDKLKLKNAV